MRAMFKTFIVTAALCLPGCFLPTPKELVDGRTDAQPMAVFHVDKRFTASEVDCINFAANLWRTQTGGKADIRYAYDYDPTDPVSVTMHTLDHKVVRYQSDTDVVREWDKEAGLKAGQKDFRVFGQVSIHNGLQDPWHRALELRLVVDRITDQHVCRMTAAHELGHVFGIQHLNDPADMMYSSIENSRRECMSSNDLQAFCNINNCTGYVMKDCEGL